MKTQNNIFIFVAVSLLLHVALFIQITPQDIILPANSGNIISITISENKIVTTKPSILPTTKEQVTEKPLKNKDETGNKLALIAKKNIIQKKSQATSIPASTQVPQQTSKAASQTKIISLLRDKLKQHFYYPKIAQRQNWQGKVLLIFDINTHGLIKNITVKQSSGYSILDNAAMNSLTKVATIPQDWIKSEYYSSLKLTVKYRLEES